LLVAQGEAFGFALVIRPGPQKKPSAFSEVPKKKAFGFFFEGKKPSAFFLAF